MNGMHLRLSPGEAVSNHPSAFYGFPCTVHAPAAHITIVQKGHGRQASPISLYSPSTLYLILLTITPLYTYGTMQLLTASRASLPDVLLLSRLHRAFVPATITSRAPHLPAPIIDVQRH
jgi:hypothetical protein